MSLKREELLGWLLLLGTLLHNSFLRRCWMRREHRHEEKPHGREMWDFHRPGVGTAA